MAAVFLCCVTTALAQTLTQTIRGTVVDHITQSPLPGASIILLNADNFTGTTADANGTFSIKQVPVGKQSLRISFMGYKEITVPNIIVNSGKESVLLLSLEENIIQGKEVVVIGKVEKNKPLNEYSQISARTFSVEETQKFAAAVNDPGRMATAFSGVVSTDDGNNAIAIRGNSPNGLQWKMEGVEIPNPNHFSNVGTSGGGISILSAQVLSNSDFSTGAFAAEYGNALSGIFDLKLRKGNNQKREYTFQTGLLGMDVAAEGPFKKGYDGSYLVNYRYSTLSLLSNIGVQVGEGVTNFQDVSYNVFMPTKKYGNFSLFGFGGFSKQTVDAKKDSTKWENSFERYNRDFTSATGTTGLIHVLPINSNTFLRSSVSFAVADKLYNEDKLLEDYSTRRDIDLDYSESRLSASTTLIKKISPRLSSKSGLTINQLLYSFKNIEYDLADAKQKTLISQKGKTTSFQAFTQWSYKFSEQISMVGGVHGLLLAKNNSYSIEPRGSLKYHLTPSQSFSIGYGLHGQLQPLGVYFAQVQQADGGFLYPNKNIGLSKAHHLVLGYDRSLNEFLHLKTEVYAQQLYNIPVGTEADKNLSLLNSEGGFTTDYLVNKGKGRNYGLEIMLEQYMRKDLYFLLSTSIYDSKFSTLNGKWFNTRFNGNYAGSFTAGKEFKTRAAFRGRILGVNIKAMYSGGLRETPIDLEASVQKGETVYDHHRPYTIKNKDYFRTDLKFSVKRNRTHSTVTWSLDLQNATNRKNIYGKYFDPLTGKTKIVYQTLIIPVLSYKIDF